MNLKDWKLRNKILFHIVVLSLLTASLLIFLFLQTHPAVITVLLTMAVLAFIILRLFEKLINRPISEMKAKMKQVQAGDLSVRISPLRADEIGGLAEDFNLMISRLDEANQTIESLYRAQMEKAEHLASLGELAAGLAHEIKNPLAGLFWTTIGRAMSVN
jgi:methyl-accepting chemotaxis protein